jgi:hypothetical protein
VSEARARVRDEHIFLKARGIDYLTWLTELFFSTKVLEEAQASGAVPDDEPIDPMMFVMHPRIAGSFPLILAAPARFALQKYAKQGIILGAVPTMLTSRDDHGVTKTVAMISAPNGKTLCRPRAGSERASVSETLPFRLLVLHEPRHHAA